MIYEIAQLPVHKEQIETFRAAFAEVAPLLSRAEGYCGHVLAQGIETPELFHLIVRWKSFEDHERSHANELFTKKFSALASMCVETKELGYDLLWQGQAGQRS